MKQKPHKILFVCLGNICRSPAAEAVMQQLVDRAGLHDNFVIDSAGTYGGHAGEPADLAPSTEAAAKIYRMVAFCRRSDATYVPDPYYEGHEGFELVLDLLEDACEGLLEDLVKQE